MNTELAQVKKLNKKTWRNTIAFLRSEIWVGITLFVILIPMMWHTAKLVLNVSSIDNHFYAWFFAFGFDFAILTFALNGRRIQATGLAFGIFVINVCFFNLETLYVWFSGEPLPTKLLVRFVVTTIISAMGSYIVHSYVVFFNDRLEAENELDSVYQKLSVSETENIGLVHKMSAASKQLTESNGKLLEKDFIIKQLEETVTEFKKGNDLLNENITKLSRELSILKKQPPNVSSIQEYTCQTCSKKFPDAEKYTIFSKWCQMCPQKSNGEIKEVFLNK